MITTKLSVTPNCPELRGSIETMQYPAFAEVKIDGEFCMVHVDGEHSFTVNKYGRARTGFNDLNLLVQKMSGRRAVFLAELCHGAGKNGDLYELLKNKESNDLQLYIFDILMFNGKDVRHEFLVDRREAMVELLGNMCAPCKLVQSHADVVKFYTKTIKEGYEGIVVKSLNSKLILGVCSWAKVKYKDQSDYKVVTIDPVQERIEVAVPTSIPLVSNPVIVGVKALNKYKKNIAVGMTVTIEHQGVLASGSLRHPVLIPRKEWK